MRVWRPDGVDLPFILIWSTLLVAVEGFRQRRRVRQIRHARDADPVLVPVTPRGPAEPA